MSRKTTSWHRLLRRPKRLTALIGILAILATLWGLQSGWGGHARLSALLFDSFQRQAPRASTPDPGVAVIDISERAIGAVGQWPWPRDILADLVIRLTQAGTAAIAFDMAFPEADRTSLSQLAQRLAARGTPIILPPDPMAQDNDHAFAAAIADAPVVLGAALSNELPKALPAPKAGLAYLGDNPTLRLPDFQGGLGNVASLHKAASGLGIFSFPPAQDNVVRQLPLVVRNGTALHPGLAIEALRVAQGASGMILRSTSAGIEALRVGALTLPSGTGGEFWLHFSGMAGMQVISAEEVLTAPPQTLAPRLEGRIVLIGTSAIGLRDLVATPLATGVPGVFVHAELIDQVLNEDFLARPDWAKGAELATAVALALLLLVILTREGAAASLLALPALAALAIYLAWYGFTRHGLLLDAVPALLLLLVIFVLCVPILLLLGHHERRFVRSAFGRYLSPAMVTRLSQDPSALRLGGETREVTVLFSDIRGFTSLSENLGPTELTELLNDILTPLTDVLLAQDATIDKYIGDAVMAFWNAPLDTPEHTVKALRAALGMQEVMGQINQTRGTQLEIGLGLHVGPACVGNLGSAQRFSYSAIGDTVNLASRVEGMTKQYGARILITEAARAEAPHFATLSADLVRVVGRKEPVELHLLLGDESMAQSLSFHALAEQHARFIALWRGGDFALAREALPALLMLAPAELRAFYAIYTKRLDQVLQHPPASWDGIYTATQK